MTAVRVDRGRADAFPPAAPPVRAPAGPPSDRLEPAPTGADAFSIGRVAVQPKLQVSVPGDALEAEADRVAERVMRGPVRPKALHAAPVSVTRLGAPPVARQEVPDDRATEGEEDEIPDSSVLLSLKAAAAPPAVVSGGLEARVRALDGCGAPLDASTRGFFESRFGHAFGHVRVHADAAAAQTAHAVGARAFTLGRNIAFASGEYRPHAEDGRRLLAHELTHVLQQGAGVRTVMRACACTAVAGARTPTAAEQTFLGGQFPRLRAGDWCVTAPATPTYNCFAWSAGITTRWVDTEIDSVHGDNDGTLEFSDFDAFYAARGLRPVLNQTPLNAEVALYGNGATPTHAARRSPASCGFAFESKLGRYLRIVHDAYQLEGGATYGDINRFYAP